MKLFKRMSSTILGLICLVGLGSAAAAINHNIDLTLGQTRTFNHLHTDSYDYSGAFTGTGIVELIDAGPVRVSTRDNQLSSLVELLNVSAFSICDNNMNPLFSTGNLVNTLVPLPGLAVGVYTLRFVGNADGVFGAAHDVTVSAVPLPAAAWLFGATLLGYAAFSARRSV